MQSQDRLDSFVTPPEIPEEVGSSAAWRQVERRMETKLPADYKAYISTFGTGLLASFIWVYNPFSTDEFLELSSRSKFVCDSRRRVEEEEGEPAQYNFFPDEGGLLPWGHDENGNQFFWLTQGEPDNWPVVGLAARSSKWVQWEITMTTFLLKALTREIRISFWPASFPNLKSKKHRIFVTRSNVE